MFSFHEEELIKIRKRYSKEPKYADYIAEKTGWIRSKIHIQESGLAGWKHYYTCPKHSVFLTFNYFDPIHHVCPIDGEVFVGEPYNSAWWQIVLNTNVEGCYLLSVEYLLSKQDDCLQKAKKILLGYAKYYPSYEVHGDIPYNKPGKACAQALDDASFLNFLAHGYDLIKHTFTVDEQKQIENNLLKEGAKHLMDYFTPQIHNHEVAICSTIGIIGILLDNYDMIDFAVNEKYGLKYQLDHAVLSDGLWFECSIAYHLYALLWFFRYEKVARFTKYSLLKDEHYRNILYKMIIYLNNLLKADGSFPFLNDGGGSIKNTEYLLEYAYSYFQTPEVLELLNHAVANTKRSSVESLLYGSEIIAPIAKSTVGQNYFAKEGSQLAVIRGSNDKLLILKATPYGGEHDHYDRMSLSFSAFGKDVCADLGTASGYGAALHYSYFKNTGSHNTVCMNGDNMPPADTIVNHYKERAADDIYLDVETDWSREYKMPDSFTLKHWVDESYKDTYMRRIIQWCDSYFIDIFVVNSSNDFVKDYTLHIDGKLTTALTNAEYIGVVGNKAPQQHLHDAYMQREHGMIKTTYQCDGFELDIHTLADSYDLIHALGPANPSVKDLSYYILRTTSPRVVYVNVLEAHETNHAVIKNVHISIQNSTVLIHISEDSQERHFEITI